MASVKVKPPVPQKPAWKPGEYKADSTTPPKNQTRDTRRRITSPEPNSPDDHSSQLHLSEDPGVRTSAIYVHDDVVQMYVIAPDEDHIERVDTTLRDKSFSMQAGEAELRVRSPSFSQASFRISELANSSSSLNTSFSSPPLSPRITKSRIATGRTDEMAHHRKSEPLPQQISHINNDDSQSKLSAMPSTDIVPSRKSEPLPQQRNPIANEESSPSKIRKEETSSSKPPTVATGKPPIPNKTKPTPNRSKISTDSHPRKSSYPSISQQAQDSQSLKTESSSSDENDTDPFSDNSDDSLEFYNEQFIPGSMQNVSSRDAVPLNKTKTVAKSYTDISFQPPSFVTSIPKPKVMSRSQTDLKSTLVVQDIDISDNARTLPKPKQFKPGVSLLGLPRPYTSVKDSYGRVQFSLLKSQVSEQIKLSNASSSGNGNDPQSNTYGNYPGLSKYSFISRSSPKLFQSDPKPDSSNNEQNSPKISEQTSLTGTDVKIPSPVVLKETTTRTISPQTTKSMDQESDKENLSEPVEIKVEDKKSSEILRLQPTPNDVNQEVQPVKKKRLKSKDRNSDNVTAGMETVPQQDGEKAEKPKKKKRPKSKESVRNSGEGESTIVTPQTGKESTKGKKMKKKERSGSSDSLETGSISSTKHRVSIGATDDSLPTSMPIGNGEVKIKKKKRKSKDETGSSTDDTVPIVEKKEQSEFTAEISKSASNVNPDEKVPKLVAKLDQPQLTVDVKINNQDAPSPQLPEVPMPELDKDAGQILQPGVQLPDAPEKKSKKQAKEKGSTKKKKKKPKSGDMGSCTDVTKEGVADSTALILSTTPGKLQYDTNQNLSLNQNVTPDPNVARISSDFTIPHKDVKMPVTLSKDGFEVKTNFPVKEDIINASIQAPEVVANNQFDINYEPSIAVKTRETSKQTGGFGDVKTNDQGFITDNFRKATEIIEPEEGIKVEYKQEIKKPKLAANLEDARLNEDILFADVKCDLKKTKGKFDLTVDEFQQEVENISMPEVKCDLKKTKGKFDLTVDEFQQEVGNISMPEVKCDLQKTKGKFDLSVDEFKQEVENISMPLDEAKPTEQKLRWKSPDFKKEGEEILADLKPAVNVTLDSIPTDTQIEVQENDKKSDSIKKKKKRSSSTEKKKKKKKISIEAPDADLPGVQLHSGQLTLDSHLPQVELDTMLGDHAVPQVYDDSFSDIITTGKEVHAHAGNIEFVHIDSQNVVQELPNAMESNLDDVVADVGQIDIPSQLKIDLPTDSLTRDVKQNIDIVTHLPDIEPPEVDVSKVSKIKNKLKLSFRRKKEKDVKIPSTDEVHSQENLHVDIPKVNAEVPDASKHDVMAVDTDISVAQDVKINLGEANITDDIQAKIHHEINNDIPSSLENVQVGDIDVKVPKKKNKLNFSFRRKGKEIEKPTVDKPSVDLPAVEMPSIDLVQTQDQGKHQDLQVTLPKYQVDMPTVDTSSKQRTVKPAIPDKPIVADIQIPEAKMPDAPKYQVDMPSITTVVKPAIAVKPISADIQVPEAKLPNTPGLDLRAGDTDFGQVQDVKTSLATDLSTGFENIKADIKVPKKKNKMNFSFERKGKEMDEPTFDLPSVDLPTVDMPNIDQGKLQDLEVTLPEYQVDIPSISTHYDVGKPDIAAKPIVAAIKVPDAKLPDVPKYQVDMPSMNTDHEVVKPAIAIKPNFGDIQVPHAKLPDARGLDIRAGDTDFDLLQDVKTSLTPRISELNADLSSSFENVKVDNIDVKVPAKNKFNFSFGRKGKEIKKPIVDIPSVDLPTVDMPNIDLMQNQDQGKLSDLEVNLPKYQVDMPTVDASSKQRTVVLDHEVLKPVIAAKPISAAIKVPEAKLPDATKYQEDMPSIDIDYKVVKPAIAIKPIVADVQVPEAKLPVAPKLDYRAGDINIGVAQEGKTNLVANLSEDIQAKIPDLGIDLPSSLDNIKVDDSVVKVPKKKSKLKVSSKRKVKQMEKPNVDLPSVDLPSVTMPKIELKPQGKVDMPSIDVSSKRIVVDLDSPEVQVSDAPKLDLPKGIAQDLKTNYETTIKEDIHSKMDPELNIDLPPCLENVKIDDINVKVPKKKKSKVKLSTKRKVKQVEQQNIDMPPVDLPTVDIHAVDIPNVNLMAQDQGKLQKLITADIQVQGGKLPDVPKYQVDMPSIDTDYEVVKPAIAIKPIVADIQVPEAKLRDTPGLSLRASDTAFGQVQDVKTSLANDLSSNFENVKMDNIDVKVPTKNKLNFSFGRKGKEMEKPTVDLPSVDLPTVDMPNIDQGKLNDLEVTLPEYQVDIPSVSTDYEFVKPAIASEPIVADIQVPEGKLPDFSAGDADFGLAQTNLVTSITERNTDLSSSFENVKVDTIDVKVPKKKNKLNFSFRRKGKEVEKPTVDLPSVDLPTLDMPNIDQGSLQDVEVSSDYEVAVPSKLATSITELNADISSSLENVKMNTIDVKLPKKKKNKLNFSFKRKGKEKEKPTVDLPSIDLPTVNMPNLDQGKHQDVEVDMPSIDMDYEDVNPVIPVKLTTSKTELNADLSSSFENVKVDDADVKVPKKKNKLSFSFRRKGKEVETPTIDTDNIPGLQLSQDSTLSLKKPEVDLPKAEAEVVSQVPSIDLQREMQIDVEPRDPRISLDPIGANIKAPEINIDLPSSVGITGQKDEMVAEISDVLEAPKERNKLKYSFGRKGKTVNMPTINTPSTDKPTVDTPPINIPDVDLVQSQDPGKLQDITVPHISTRSTHWPPVALDTDLSPFQETSLRKHDAVRIPDPNIGFKLPNTDVNVTDQVPSIDATLPQKTVQLDIEAGATGVYAEPIVTDIDIPEVNGKSPDLRQEMTSVMHSIEEKVKPETNKPKKRKKKTTDQPYDKRKQLTLSDSSLNNAEMSAVLSEVLRSVSSIDSQHSEQYFSCESLPLDDATITIKTDDIFLDCRSEDGFPLVDKVKDIQQAADSSIRDSGTIPSIQNLDAQNITELTAADTSQLKPKKKKMKSKEGDGSLKKKSKKKVKVEIKEPENQFLNDSVNLPDMSDEGDPWSDSSRSNSLRRSRRSLDRFRVQEPESAVDMRLAPSTAGIPTSPTIGGQKLDVMIIEEIESPDRRRIEVERIVQSQPADEVMHPYTYYSETMIQNQPPALPMKSPVAVPPLPLKAPVADMPSHQPNINENTVPSEVSVAGSSTSEPIVTISPARRSKYPPRTVSKPPLPPERQPERHSVEVVPPLKVPEVLPPAVRPVMRKSALKKTPSGERVRSGHDTSADTLDSNGESVKKKVAIALPHQSTPDVRARVSSLFTFEGCPPSPNRTADDDPDAPLMADVVTAQESVDIEGPLKGADKDPIQLSYIDFLPGQLDRHHKFATFDNLVDRANIWLEKRPNFVVFRCETIEFKKRSDEDGKVDNNKTSYKSMAGKEKKFVKVLRLWIRDRNTEDPGGPDFLGYFNILPQQMDGRDGSANYTSLPQAIEHMNSCLKSDPIPGKILTVEHLEMKVMDMDEELDPDCNFWVEDDRTNTTVYFARVYFKHGEPIREELDCVDFVPKIMMGSRSLSKCGFESLTGVVKQARDWLNHRKKQYGRLVSVQSFNYRTTYNWGSKHPDTSQMVYVQGRKTTHLIQCIRLTLTNVSNAMDVMPGVLKPFVRLHHKSFVPVLLTKPGMMTKINFETFSQTMNRAIAWINAAKIKTDMQGSTRPVSLENGGCQVFAIETSKMRVKRSSRALKPDDVNTALTGEDELVLFFIRVYLDGPFAEPPPGDLPPVNEPSGHDPCCSLS